MQSGTYTVVRIKQNNNSDKYTVAINNKKNKSVINLDAEKFKDISLTEKSDKLKIKVNSTGKIADVKNVSLFKADKKADEVNKFVDDVIKTGDNAADNVQGMTNQMCNFLLICLLILYVGAAVILDILES